MRIEIRLSIISNSIQKDVHEIINFEDIRCNLKNIYNDEIMNVESLGQNKRTDLYTLTDNRFIKYHGDTTDYLRGRRPSNVLFSIGNSENDNEIDYEKYIHILKTVYIILQRTVNTDKCNYKLKIHIERCCIPDNKYLNSLLHLFKRNQRFNINTSDFMLSGNEKITIETKTSETFKELEISLQSI